MVHECQLPYTPRMQIFTSQRLRAAVSTSLFAVLFLFAFATGTVEAQSRPDFTLDPAFGSVRLESGFTPDPFSVSIVAGGPVDLRAWNNNYRGYVAVAPDYSLFYEAGSTFDLTIYIESDVDTVILINAPDAQYYFFDDFDGLDGGFTFESPQSGRYDIWVGTYSESDFGAQTNLLITEIY